MDLIEDISSMNVPLSVYKFQVEDVNQIIQKKQQIKPEWKSLKISALRGLGKI